MMFPVSPLFRQIACRSLSPSFLPFRPLTGREFHISAFVQKQFIDLNISSGPNKQNSSLYPSSEITQMVNPETTQNNQKAATDTEKKVRKLTAEEKESRFFSTKFRNLKRSWKKGDITFDQYRNELGKIYDERIASLDKYIPKVKLMSFEEFKVEENLLTFEQYKDEMTKTYQRAIKAYPDSPRSAELKKHLETSNFEDDYNLYCRGLYNGYVRENSNEPNPFQKIL